MGRWSFAAVALVAAVPAGYLSYLMVSTFLNRAESLETMFQVLAATTLAFSALVTLLPIAILIFVRKAAPMDEAETAAAAGAGTPAREMPVTASDDAVEPVDLEEEFAADDEEADEFEDEFEEEFDVEDAEEDEFYAEGEDDFEEFDMDEFEDEK